MASDDIVQRIVIEGDIRGGALRDRIA